MVIAGIKVPDTVLVRDAIDLSRSASEPFSSTMRCAPGYSAYCFQKALNVLRMPSLLAVATILHDLGLTDRYTAEIVSRWWRQCGALVSEGARHLDAADASCLGCHRASYHAIHRSSQKPEVAMTHSGIMVDVLGAGLDRIPQDKQGAILAEFPRLA